MDMKQYFSSRIARVVEEDVGGCGGNAENFVECTQNITPEMTEQLEAMLKQVKSDPATKDYGTDDYIEAAVERFNEANGLLGCGHIGPQMRVIGLPYESTITF